eukprot:PITA_16959
MKKWEQAMKEEIDSLAHNQTWDLVRLTAGKTTLQNKWVYRLKEEDGGKQRYKARLVVKGFAQKKGSNMQEINVLKRKLENSFAMKDLGAAKKILDMRITRDRKNRKLTLSQSEYIEKVLKRFNMQNEKPVSIPLARNFKLSKEACPKTQEEMACMYKVSYALAVGSLMYAMVCTRPDIAHAVGVVSR